MKLVDKFLNKFTMYQLTLYYLIVLVSLAFLLSFFGFLAYNPKDIIISTSIALVVCWVFNFIFSKFFNAVTNIESVFITALILVLIIPVKFPLNATFFMLAGAFAMGSKYFVTVEKRHIFNPAAAAVGGIALLSSEHSATWWVGTPVMLPFVIIGGLLLVRKIQRESMVFTFLLAYLGLTSLLSFYHSGNIMNIVTTLNISTIHTALFFFAFVMFTEPLTAPSTANMQYYYALIVAVLYATPQINFGNFVLTPELALCAGNVFSYIVNPKYRLEVTLKNKISISQSTYIFMFEHINNFKFIPGQYMEWTLPHHHVDSRGNRRYFSLASSPEEENILLMVKFYEQSSSYKKKLLSLTPGQKIVAAQLAGDFTLPKDLSRPLVFIAGGVGIAPFRSMIDHIVAKNLKVNIVVLYANRNPEDIAFIPLLEQARTNGVQTHYILTNKDKVPQNWQGLVGYIDENIVKQIVPDYMLRQFYLSGPQLMVDSFIDVLHRAGVHNKSIKHDFFPGYAET